MKKIYFFSTKINFLRQQKKNLYIKLNQIQCIILSIFFLPSIESNGYKKIYNFLKNK